MTDQTKPEQRYKLVPVEPTEEMLDTLHNKILIECIPEKREANIKNDREIWQAMLAAAPEQPAPQPLLSDMDRAVLTMPIELAMSDGASRFQFYQRVQSLVRRIDGQETVSQPVHASDCAMHNAPAYESGPCDCGAAPPDAVAVIRQLADALKNPKAGLIAHKGEWKSRKEIALAAAAPFIDGRKG